MLIFFSSAFFFLLMQKKTLLHLSLAFSDNLVVANAENLYYRCAPDCYAAKGKCLDIGPNTGELNWTTLVVSCESPCYF